VNDREAAPDDILDERTAGRKLVHGLIAIAVLAALVVGLILAVPGLRGVGRTVEHMKAGWILAGVGLELLSCIGYVVAFLQVFERAPIRFGARVALTEQAFGAAVSLGGAGSLAIGAWMLIERGAQPTRVAERSAVLFLLTSGVNVITLALAGLGLWVGVLPGPRDPLLNALPGAVGVIVLVLFLALPQLAEGPVARRAPGRVKMLMEASVQSVRDTRKLLFTLDWRVLGAIVFLWADIGVLVVCFAATGHTPPLASIVLAYQICYLANIIPIPGGIGVLDGSLIGMLVIYGVNATDATAATVVYHAIALWVPAVWGTIAFVILRLTKNNPLTLRPSRAERRQLRAEQRAARRRD
jgi:uncharacterized membrane protein YbhN (UPF0104 family)